MPTTVAPEYSLAHLTGKENARPRRCACRKCPILAEDIFGILQRFDVRQAPYVPDAGHSQLIDRVLGTPSMRAVPLTTEEEGVALSQRLIGTKVFVK